MKTSAARMYRASLRDEEQGWRPSQMLDFRRVPPAGVTFAGQRETAQNEANRQVRPAEISAVVPVKFHS